MLWLNNFCKKEFLVNVTNSHCVQFGPRCKLGFMKKFIKSVDYDSLGSIQVLERKILVLLHFRELFKNSCKIFGPITKIWLKNYFQCVKNLVYISLKIHSLHSYIIYFRKNLEARQKLKKDSIRMESTYIRRFLLDTCKKPTPRSTKLLVLGLRNKFKFNYTVSIY